MRRRCSGDSSIEPSTRWSGNTVRASCSSVATRRIPRTFNDYYRFLEYTCDARRCSLRITRTVRSDLASASFASSPRRIRNKRRFTVGFTTSFTRRASLTFPSTTHSSNRHHSSSSPPVCISARARRIEIVGSRAMCAIDGERFRSTRCFARGKRKFGSVATRFPWGVARR